MDLFDVCKSMSDEALIAGLDRLASADKVLTTELLAHLSAVDNRSIVRKLGFSSLYVYCTKKLRFSESVAFSRIFAARQVERFRFLAPMLEAGEITLTTITILGQHFTKENAYDLSERCKGKSRREVEDIAASLAPGPARRDIMMRAPIAAAAASWPALEPAPGGPSATASPISFSFDKIEAVDGEKVRLHFDVGPETAKLLERAREVMKHKFPLASFEDIVKEALKLLLEERDPEIKLKLEKENAREVLTEGRRVPVWVRRKVWRRDGGRCAYVAADGTRCGERGGLEYDHVIPYAKGGRSDEPGNIRLLCRAHNQLNGWLEFPPGSTGPAATA